MRIRRSQIQAIAATALATLASLFAVYIDPYIDTAPVGFKVIAVAISAPALFFCFMLTQGVLRWWYHRKILGIWHYITISGVDEFVDENYAIMRFYFDIEGTLRYHVQLFGSLDDLQREENSRGSAESEAIDYDAEKEVLHILYAVNLYSDAIPRRGRLFLELQKKMAAQAGRELNGEWGSVVNLGDRSVVSRGQMFAARPKEFSEKLPGWKRRNAGGALGEEHEQTNTSL